jgi:general secretion pathway protein F
MRVQLNVVRGRSAPEALAVQAASLDDARAQAVSLGYAVLSVRPSSAALPSWPLRGKRHGNFDIAVFVEQLRDLLLAGLSVIEALDAQRRGAKGAAVLVIDGVVRKLREGQSLSNAFAAEPTFPPLLIALVQAAELTSDLADSLSRYLDHDRRVTEIRHRLVSTAIYPMLLMGVGTLVLMFLMFYVMPRFARIFEGTTVDLPWSARAMVVWSQTLHAHGGLWLAAAAAVVFALAAAAASPGLRARVFESLMNHGLLRDHLKVYFLSRWYRATGMLVQGGIALPQALGLANQLLPLALRDRGLQVEAGVRDGLTPSAAHARAGMVTPVAEQLMLAGERTGDLGTVLTRIANFHEAEASRAMERAMRALEPVVMVLVGLGVGIVVVLMYLPIFELASAIQ